MEMGDQLIAALRETWAIWARTGAQLDADGWRRPSRCPGWDVAALFTHVSLFPLALDGPLPRLPPGPARPLDAVEVLRRFARPEGVARAMAETVAAAAVEDAAAHDAHELVARFAVVGPRALDKVAAMDPAALVSWPASGGVVPLSEGLRIVLLESVVHLLDVQHGLQRPPTSRPPRCARRSTCWPRSRRPWSSSTAPPDGPRRRCFPCCAEPGRDGITAGRGRAGWRAEYADRRHPAGDGNSETKFPSGGELGGAASGRSPRMS